MMRLPFACSSLIFPIRGACTGKAGATPRQGTDKSVAMADEKAFYYRRKRLLTLTKKAFITDEKGFFIMSCAYIARMYPLL